MACSAQAHLLGPSLDRGLPRSSCPLHRYSVDAPRNRPLHSSPPCHAVEPPVLTNLPERTDQPPPNSSPSPFHPDCSQPSLLRQPRPAHLPGRAAAVQLPSSYHEGAGCCPLPGGAVRLPHSPRLRLLAAMRRSPPLLPCGLPTSAVSAPPANLPACPPPSVVAPYAWGYTAEPPLGLLTSASLGNGRLLPS
jgi:hypothetical protein